MTEIPENPANSPDGRWVSPVPPPTDYERELLTILIEECAEVQQRATKSLRFGPTEVQPGQSLSNNQRLARELGDLYAVASLAEEAGLLNPREIDDAIREKHRKLKKFMQTRKSNA